jgi:hypothetical protein
MLHLPDSAVDGQRVFVGVDLAHLVDDGHVDIADMQVVLDVDGAGEAGQPAVLELGFRQVSRVDALVLVGEGLRGPAPLAVVRRRQHRVVAFARAEGQEVGLLQEDAREGSPLRVVLSEVVDEVPRAGLVRSTAAT